MSPVSFFITAFQTQLELGTICYHKENGAQRNDKIISIVSNCLLCQHYELKEPVVEWVVVCMNIQCYIIQLFESHCFDQIVEGILVLFLVCCMPVYNFLATFFSAFPKVPSMRDFLTPVSQKIRISAPCSVCTPKFHIIVYIFFIFGYRPPFLGNP